MSIGGRGRVSVGIYASIIYSISPFKEESVTVVTATGRPPCVDIRIQCRLARIVAASRNREDYQRYLERRIGKFRRLPPTARTEDVANAVLFLACPESSFVTGRCLHVAGGAELARSGWS
jgi:NAD(P)-dependent dehydrogenase (short-subunit alcohol dehydrogenase family)